VTCFALAIALVCVWYALSEAEEPGVVQFLVRTATTVKVPPQCLVADGNGGCQVDFVRKLQVQVRDPIWAYGDAWTTYKGKVYHAHVWRFKFGAYYLWFWEGARVWWYKVQWWVAHDRGGSIGPALPLPALAGHASCPQAAPVFAVPLTTDAGTLLQPQPVRYCNQATNGPTDAGPPKDSCYTVQPGWPDGSVAKCGTKWWLMRNRYGGQPLIKWADVDAGEVLGPEYQGPDPGQGQNTPMEADAATTKTCPNVPIGTACP
jgi:hypothetical protein